MKPEIVVVKGPMFEYARKKAIATFVRIINRKLNEQQPK